MNTRDEIVRTITENLEQFASAEHIEALFMVTCEDLIAGGVAPVRVRASMLRSWVRQQQTEIGKPGVVQILRDLADAMERHPIADGRPN